MVAAQFIPHKQFLLSTYQQSSQGQNSYGLYDHKKSRGDSPPDNQPLQHVIALVIEQLGLVLLIALLELLDIAVLRTLITPKTSPSESFVSKPMFIAHHMTKYPNIDLAIYTLQYEIQVRYIDMACGSDYHIIYLCIKEHLSKIGNNHTKKLRLLFRQYTEFSHHLCISLRDFLEK